MTSLMDPHKLGLAAENKGPALLAMSMLLSSKSGGQIGLLFGDEVSRVTVTPAAAPPPPDPMREKPPAGKQEEGEDAIWLVQRLLSPPRDLPGRPATTANERSIADYHQDDPQRGGGGRGRGRGRGRRRRREEALKLRGGSSIEKSHRCRRRPQAHYMVVAPASGSSAAVAAAALSAKLRQFIFCFERLGGSRSSELRLCCYANEVEQHQQSCSDGPASSQNGTRSATQIGSLPTEFAVVVLLCEVCRGKKVSEGSSVRSSSIGEGSEQVATTLPLGCCALHSCNNNNVCCASNNNSNNKSGVHCLARRSCCWTRKLATCQPLQSRLCKFLPVAVEYLDSERRENHSRRPDRPPPKKGIKLATCSDFLSRSVWPPDGGARESSPAPPFGLLVKPIDKAAVEKQNTNQQEHDHQNNSNNGDDLESATILLATGVAAAAGVGKPRKVLTAGKRSTLSWCWIRSLERGEYESTAKLVHLNYVTPGSGSLLLRPPKVEPDDVVLAAASRATTLCQREPPKLGGSSSRNSVCPFVCKITIRPKLASAEAVELSCLSSLEAATSADNQSSLQAAGWCSSSGGIGSPRKTSKEATNAASANRSSSSGVDQQRSSEHSNVYCRLLLPPPPLNCSYTAKRTCAALIARQLNNNRGSPLAAAQVDWPCSCCCCCWLADGVYINVIAKEEKAELAKSDSVVIDLNHTASGRNRLSGRRSAAPSLSSLFGRFGAGQVVATSTKSGEDHGGAKRSRVATILTVLGGGGGGQCYLSADKCSGNGGDDKTAPGAANKLGHHGACWPMANGDVLLLVVVVVVVSKCGLNANERVVVASSIDGGQQSRVTLAPIYPLVHPFLPTFPPPPPPSLLQAASISPLSENGKIEEKPFERKRCQLNSGCYFPPPNCSLAEAAAAASNRFNSSSINGHRNHHHSFAKLSTAATGHSGDSGSSTSTTLVATLITLLFHFKCLCFVNFTMAAAAALLSSVVSTTSDDHDDDRSSGGQQREEHIHSSGNSHNRIVSMIDYVSQCDKSQRCLAISQQQQDSSTGGGNSSLPAAAAVASSSSASAPAPIQTATLLDDDNNNNNNNTISVLVVGGFSSSRAAHRSAAVCSSENVSKNGRITRWRGKECTRQKGGTRVTTRCCCCCQRRSRQCCCWPLNGVVCALLLASVLLVAVWPAACAGGLAYRKALVATLLATTTTNRVNGAAGEPQLKAPEGASSVGKLEFWSELVSSVLGDVSGGSSSERQPALERIAHKLATWPDQKQAALYYLDLLAKRRDRAPATTSAGSGDTNTNGNGPPPMCRRTSLAELSASSSEFAAAAAAAATTLKSLPTTTTTTTTLNIEHSLENNIRGLVRLNELNSDTVSSELMRKVNQEGGKFVDLAKLAVENANLISRLLIHPESEVIKGIASQKFFKYLLESKVRQQLSSHAGQQKQRQRQQRSNNHQTSTGNNISLLHSAGLIFIEQQQQPASSADRRQRRQASGQAKSANLAPTIDRRPARRATDTAEAGDSVALTERHQQSGLFAPLAVVVERASGDDDNDGQVQFVDLASHRVAGNSLDSNAYFGPLSPSDLVGGAARVGVSGVPPTGQAAVQPFYAKWLLAAKERELWPLERKMAQVLEMGTTDNQEQDQEQQEQKNASNSFYSSSRQANSLTIEDGRWFSPYFDCGVANRWLITYSIPFFSSNNNEGPDNVIKFRGVSFVNLDFGRAKLIDQCASEHGAAFFADTHHCASRLQGSQCVRLEDFEDVRSGAYVCQCPAGGSVSADDRRAATEHRDKLTELVINLAAANSTYALDQLSLELDERLGDKSLVADQLLQTTRHNQQQQQQQHATASTIPTTSRSKVQQSKEYSGQYFMLGAQIHSDNALEWFTGDANEQPWPVQVCRICRQTSNDSHSRPHHHNNRHHPSNPSITAAVCNEFQSSNSNWIRPIVLTLQSICVLITLTLTGVLLRVRKSRIILVSGWLMLETALVGALLLYSSVFVRYFEPTSITCLLEPWLRELGFSIFYGSILIKLYRILTEFQTRKAHRVCFRDKDQIVYLLAIVLIVVGYMSAWTALMVDGFFFGRHKTAGGGSQTTNTLQATTIGADSSSAVAFPASSSSPMSSSSSGDNSGPLESPASSVFDPFLLYNNNNNNHNHANDYIKRPTKRDTTPTLTTPQAPYSSSAQSPSNMLASLHRQLRSHLKLEEVAEEPAAPDDNDLHSQHQHRHQHHILQHQGGAGGGTTAEVAAAALTAVPTTTTTTTAAAATVAISSGHYTNSVVFNPTASDRVLNYSLDLATSSGNSSIYSDSTSSSSLASAVDQLADYAPEQLRVLARNLNSFGELFSGLLEQEEQYDEFTESLTYSMRCRKLTWDYVTELSEMALLLFGIYLVYKLRNASSEVHKEKLVLCASVFIELFVSALAYTIRHLLWNQLTSDQILVLYCARCQLTVTLTIALIFGPKLWSISKSKPTFFSSGNRSGGSMRHRCHITCEIHDHHLNDAMRLHQAMLSNAALDIGNINLADMDPDEIQTELKRVYAQLEVLKTKAMRRDNPHISKRRGGRKTGHRKFSLQAFHAKHIGHHSSSHHQSSSSQQQNMEHSGQSLDGNSTLKSTTNTTDHKLPVVVENQNEPMMSPMDKTSAVAEAARKTMAANERRVRVDEAATSNRSELRAGSHHHKQQRSHPNRHQRQSPQQHQQGNSNTSQRHSLILPDPTSTSSAGVYFDDDTMILNDSQSSGNVSPQRQSSFVCSQSSIHPEDSSIN